MSVYSKLSNIQQQFHIMLDNIGKNRKGMVQNGELFWCLQKHSPEVILISGVYENFSKKLFKIKNSAKVLFGIIL